MVDVFRGSKAGLAVLAGDGGVDEDAEEGEPDRDGGGTQVGAAQEELAGLGTSKADGGSHEKISCG